MKPLTSLQNRRLNWAAEVLLWGSLLLYVLVVFYSVDKGLDFEDDGYYLLRYQQIQPLAYSFPAEHLLVRALYPLLQPDAVTLRVLNNILAMISATLLFFGVKYYTQRKTTVVFGASWHYAAVLGGGMSMLSSGLSLSYNSLTVFFTEWAVAALLVALATPRWRWLWLGLAGAAVGLLLYTKITSFFAVGGLLILFVLVQPEQWSRRFSALAGMGLGLITLLLLLNWWIEPGIVEYYRVVFARFKAAPGSHGGVDLLRNMWHAFIDIIQQAGWALLMLFLIFHPNLRKHRLCQIGLITLLGLVIFKADIVPFLRGRINPRFFWLLLFGLLFKGYFEKEQVKGGVFSEKRGVLLVLLCLFTPFAISFGHNYDLINHTYISTAFVLLAILFFIPNHKHWVAIVTMGVFLGMFSFRLYFKPYLKPPLAQHQKEFGGLKLNDDYYSFFNRLDSTLMAHDFKVSDGLVDLYRMPGLVYLLETYNPLGILWNENALHGVVKRYTLEENKPWIIMKDVVKEDMELQLKEIGIDIQEDYLLVDRLDNPYGKKMGQNKLGLFRPKIQE